MKLLTKEIEQKLTKTPLYSTDGQGKKAKVICKFFGGASSTWLVTEGEKRDNGDWEFFGAANLGYGWELGYFMLSELQAIRFPPFGLCVEREKYYTPCEKTLAEFLA